MSNKQNENTLRDSLACFALSQWKLFAQHAIEKRDQIDCIIERWEGNLDTEFQDLTDEQKEFFNAIADNILSIVSNNLRERLAEYAHNTWAGWMDYLFDNSTYCTFLSAFNGTYIIPKTLVERWMRQMQTPYHDLPEQEKESDRKEANSILKIISGVE